MKKIFFIGYIISLVATLVLAVYVFVINRDLSTWLVVVPAIIWVVLGALYRNEKMKETLKEMEERNQKENQ